MGEHTYPNDPEIVPHPSLDDLPERSAGEVPDLTEEWTLVREGLEAEAAGRRLEAMCPQIPSWVRTPAGRGRSCEVCGAPMLASLSGRGYCPHCASPVDDIPLVPLTWSPQTFLQLQSKWRRSNREHNEDLLTWSRRLLPGSAPGALRCVKLRREGSSQVDHLLAPLPESSARRGTGRPPGRPRKLSLAEERRFRRTAEGSGCTVAKLAGEFELSPRAVRRYLGRLGLKLKKRLARRARHARRVRERARRGVKRAIANVERKETERLARLRRR